MPEVTSGDDGCVHSLVRMVYLCHGLGDICAAYFTPVTPELL